MYSVAPLGDIIATGPNVNQLRHKPPRPSGLFSFPPIPYWNSLLTAGRIRHLASSHTLLLSLSGVNELGHPRQPGYAITFIIDLLHPGVGIGIRSQSLDVFFLVNGQLFSFPLFLGHQLRLCNRGFQLWGTAELTVVQSSERALSRNGPTFICNIFMSVLFDNGSTTRKGVSWTI